MSPVVEELRPTQNVHRIHTSAAKCARKRKHDQMDESSDDWHPFDIQSGTGGQSQLLTPRFLIPRSCLPLAYLAPSGDSKATSGSRLFAAHIKLLDGCDNAYQQARPTVLIAQRKSGTFYAIEKVHDRIFALCRLAPWVTEGALEILREPALTTEAPRKRQCHNDLALSTNEWWHSAAAPSHANPLAATASKSAISRVNAFKLSLKRPVQKSCSPVPAQSPPATPTAQEPGVLNVGVLVENEVQKLGDVFKLIKTQYQEALYLSKASLAYFAKGPLSRARASFPDNNGSTNDCSKLVKYLRTMILPLPVMDKKYRETLPNIVQEFPFSILSDVESISVIETVKKKSRKSKKDKVGKDGLYAGEDVSIAKWWLGRDFTGGACDTEEARKDSLKTTILEQRAREAQMQIIVVLETLALEASATVSGIKLAAGEGPGEEQGEGVTKKKKPKKPQDLHMLLDLLADRLCIWQSMNSDVEKPSGNESRPLSEFEKKAEAAASSDDHLRQFCIDVVLPFYGARLPELSTLLCQKLGGPKDPSPKRAPPMTLEAISKVSAKPGAPVQRQQPRKPRRTLERVLTDDRSRYKRQAPSLSRSATEPVLPQVKREVSDTSLSSIPLNRVAISKRYTQREVDLRAASQATEARHKKKVAIQQELQGAIVAIKRPNPKMAGKEFVETVEKRQASSQSRKPKNPVRNPFAQGLQVMATPSKKKKAEAYKLPSLSQARNGPTAYEVDEIPPSSVSHIPSSTMKVCGPTSSSDKELNKTFKRPSSFVDQTPTRSSAKFSDHPSFPSDRASPGGLSQHQRSYSFLKPPGVAKTSDEPHRFPAWHANAHETPPKQDRVVLQTSPMPAPNFAGTPCKRPSAKSRDFGTPSRSSQREEQDIYASLGWNDDIDD